MNRLTSVKKFPFRLIIIFILFFLFAWGGYNKIYQAAATYQEKKARDEKLFTLGEKKARLEDEFEKLQNTSIIEREAKERFNLKHPGEKVVVIVPPKSDAQDVSQDSRSFWERIKSFFTE